MATDFYTRSGNPGLKWLGCFLFIFLFTGFYSASAGNFPLVTNSIKVSIVYDARECKLDSIAANLLADDIKRVSGYRPSVLTNLDQAKGAVIIIGSIKSKLILDLNKPLLKSELKDKWECYSFSLLDHPTKNINQALIIAGSDFRGTAFGVFELSARIGVTPWCWWADVTPKTSKELQVNIAPTVSAEPSVKYRGIFINDEDWGLQPWAAKTFEPETGDIGPKTYAKVFELLLRLKANFIWPAMHPSTKAFFHYPGNVKVAGDYQIVIGSSHAEPMLRNNVGEWDMKAMGRFNYLTNTQKVSDYWEERVKQSAGLDGVYTIGMRGVHDSGIEGVKTTEETVPLLERIFKDQRTLLKKYIDTPIAKIPQAFAAYKEVLDVYDAGLKVPDDVTLIWPDDNYGYIQRLSNKNEEKRSGGSGVYYHASYWGRPHDYLWLSSTNPGLIREEMTKAYQMNDRKIWVVNVGDIKPAEYNIQFFLDMAYHIQPFFNSDYPKKHLNKWVTDNIDKAHSPAITDLLWQYYQLAFERRPEFMGWNQTEPTTQTQLTAYNHFDFGDQAQKRIDSYSALESKAKKLKNLIGSDRQASFFQLVYYPVVGAASMNKKFLFSDNAALYSKQGRLIAAYDQTQAKEAYEQIVKETDFYNTKLSNGKWTKIMSMNPRNLPVFNPPKTDYVIAKTSLAWGIMPEGTDSASRTIAVPVFNSLGKQSHFFDIYLTRDTTLSYHIKPLEKWIRVSKLSGKLSPLGLNSQQRVIVSVDISSLPKKGLNEGLIEVSTGDRKFNVSVSAVKQLKKPGKSFYGFIPGDGYISIYAKHYQEKNESQGNYWHPVSGLGRTESSVEALPVSNNHPPMADTSDMAIKHSAALTYRFFNTAAHAAEFKIYTLPTYPLNKSFQMRYGVSIDNGPVTILNFKTTGRSEEWKQAVLSNSICRSVKMPSISAGEHTLKIYMIDPGVILDRIVIDLANTKPFYGLLPESEIITKTVAARPSENKKIRPETDDEY